VGGVLCGHIVCTGILPAWEKRCNLVIRLRALCNGMNAGLLVLPLHIAVSAYCDTTLCVIVCEL